MQFKQKDPYNLSNLLEFQYPDIFQKAMTFKQYYQEYTSRNKDNPLKFGTNENFIELGSDLIDFYYTDFFVSQELPNKDHKTFKTFADIRRQKQTVLSEKNLAEIAQQLGLKDKMFVSTNTNNEIKNNQKIQTQALKAVIGGHYFDKQKDLNLLRNLMMILYQNLIKKSLDESMCLPKSENFKGDFKEYMDKHPEFSYKLNYLEYKSKFDQNQTIYEYELVINDVLPIKRDGEQKRIVERQVFKDAMQLLKSDQFQQLLDDSIRSQLDQTIDKSCYNFQESELNQQKFSSEIHKILQFEVQQGKLEQGLEKQDFGNLIDSFLQKY
ncbi:unnamed protein product [Paramecium sonneborni]|uniref:RNase III domain-containing protein n=1 Tax=Paramecium sonneborni TaxID=65129 RepID=A0A8S1RL38_9CILI|nr:unnamed protein product [Paramecium sonneborni]